MNMVVDAFQAAEIQSKKHLEVAGLNKSRIGMVLSQMEKGSELFHRKERRLHCD